MYTGVLPMDANHNFHDKIAELCLTHFKKLPKTGKPNLKEWTILTCIVLEIEEELRVVALGTGSKCIGKNKMSFLGDILNDSHAEVLCRRSFLRYLYYEMKQGKDLLIFKNETKKYCLNKSAKFHFFTTFVPCGDAAIFSKQNSDYFGSIISDEDTVPAKKLKTDIFRTGAKCLTEGEQDPKLPGINYHTVGVVRTKPGRGDSTLSVSCSDKLAKWCCLGLQGALLSLLLEEPIYLSSFTIAGNTLFSLESLKRAIYTRLGKVELPVPYHQKYLLIGQSKSDFEFSKNDSKQPCPSSICWSNVGDNSTTEVLIQGKRQGVTKKNINTPTARSKISKYELFKNFTEICRMKNSSFYESHIKTCNYRNAKLLSTNYQNSWQILKKHFKVWTQKNENLLNFVLDDKELYEQS